MFRYDVLDNIFGKFTGVQRKKARQAAASCYHWRACDPHPYGTLDDRCSRRKNEGVGALAEAVQASPIARFFVAQRAYIDCRLAPPKRSNLLAKLVLVGLAGTGSAWADPLGPSISMGSTLRASRSVSSQPRTVWKSEPDAPEVGAASGANCALPMYVTVPCCIRIMCVGQSSRPSNM
eukprot:scaffold266290_cov28-Tisochrysis_lutea.AAC.1